MSKKQSRLKKKTLQTVLIMSLVTPTILGSLSVSAADDLSKPIDEASVWKDITPADASMDTLSDINDPQKAESKEDAYLSNQNVEQGKTGEVDFEKAQTMSPQELVGQLTEDDLALHNKDKDDFEYLETFNPMDPQPFLAGPQGRAAYPNVNTYIAQNGFKHASIKEDGRIGSLPKNGYKSGKYIGVVIHETANPTSTLQNEVDFMYRNYYNAFVHAYVNANEIRQTAPADYLAWGAGANANPYFYQIELVRHNNFNDFAKSVNNDAYLTAYMLKRNGLKPTLADNNKGTGSVISHRGVSWYWGGTDHEDPIGYFAKWGYDMNQYFALVQKHYNELTGQKPTTPPANNGVTVKTNVAKDEWLQIKPNANYTYGDKAEGLSGRTVKGNVKDLKSKDVKVTRTATLSNGSTHKFITQNNKDLGWVKAEALQAMPSKTPSNTVTVKSTTVKDEWLQIKPNANYTYAEKAEGLPGRTVKGNVKDLKSKDVKVTKTAVLSNGTTHKYITQNGKNLGWVKAEALQAMPKKNAVTIKSNIAKNEWGYINKNTEYADKARGLDGRKVKANTSSLSSKDVQVTRTATLSNGTTHKFITQNNKDLGWVDASAFSTFTTIKSNVAKNEWPTLKSDVDYSDKAIGLPGRKVRGNTKSLKSKTVTVTRVATLNDGTTHKFITQSGKDLGWVPASALK